MLTTHFEAWYARRAFPCVDEPARRAVFKITITTEADKQVVSNMPVASREVFKSGKDNKSLYQSVEFLPTVKMSTYLVAFCVGDFECVQKMTKNGTLVRVLCTPGKKSLSNFALDAGVRVLEYEEFFGIRYPLPKLDMIAIPDFAMGAMENWGLVTFREVDLLCDAEKASFARQERVATVVAHELSHMWFGDLVTLSWWDQLWLKEGFARFMQHLSTDQGLYPEWRIWNYYITTCYERCLQMDGLRSSHPIEVEIHRAHDVEQVFDAISYDKGSQMVRMLYAILGPDTFRTGCQLYTRKYQYGSTVTAQLWEAFEEASGRKLKDMMASWTEQMGYPLIEVGPVMDGKCEVTQSYFLGDGSVEEGDADKKWIVPIFVGTNKTPAGEKGDLSVMSQSEMKIPVDESAKWVLFKFGALVPYRVHYKSDEMWQNILRGIEAGELSVKDRIAFIDDIWAMVRAGRSRPEEAVEALKGFAKEEDADVWQALRGVIAGMSTMCRGLGQTEGLNRLVSAMIAPVLGKVGWSASYGEDIKTRQLRANLVALASVHCRDKKEYVEMARHMMDNFFADSASLADDVRQSVFRLALGGSGLEESGKLWYQLMKVAEDPHTPQGTRVDAFATLGYVTDPMLKQRTLDWCLSPSVKPQDFFQPMLGVRASGEEAAKFCWKWLEGNFPAVFARVSTSRPNLLTNVFNCCAGGSCTEEMAQRVEALMKKYHLKIIARALSQLCESIRANARLVNSAKSSVVSSADYWSALLTSIFGCLVVGMSSAFAGFTARFGIPSFVAGLIVGGAGVGLQQRRLSADKEEHAADSGEKALAGKHYPSPKLPSQQHILERQSYVSSVNYATKIPNWVAEAITYKSVTSKNADRKRAVFKADDGVPEMFRASNADYWDSGWSRGHLSMAGAHKDDQDAQNDTFLLSGNIVPQDLSMNGSDWLRLEYLTLDLAREHGPDSDDAVYVVSGPLWMADSPDDKLTKDIGAKPHTKVVNDGSNGKPRRYEVKYEVIGDNELAVPTHMFKVVYDTKTNSSAAFIMPNKPIRYEKNLKHYQVPIERVEKATGLDLTAMKRGDDLCGPESRCVKKGGRRINSWRMFGAIQSAKEKETFVRRVKRAIDRNYLTDDNFLLTKMIREEMLDHHAATNPVELLGPGEYADKLQQAFDGLDAREGGKKTVKESA
ncbi:hypothetical protein FOZ63_027367 [Perkinsus olseni]|nr:hypothetical protein FOZ63_027367 [Perkinsus olseni]